MDPFQVRSTTSPVFLDINEEAVCFVVDAVMMLVSTQPESE